MCAFRNSQSMSSLMNLKPSKRNETEIWESKGEDSNSNSNLQPYAIKKNSRPTLNYSSTNITEDDEYSDPPCIDSDSDESEDVDLEDLFAKVDAENANDVLQLVNSANIIQRTAMEEQSLTPISKEAIIATQTEMSTKHREIVVRWLIQLNYHFKLTSDTLYNAVSFFDIYISKCPIKLSELQLYAAVCYWMSAKVDTRCQPSVEDFNKISNEHFTVEQFSKAEVEVFRALNYRLSYPTSKFFMRRLLLLTSKDQYVIEMTNFFTEIALQKWDYVGIPPYIIAVSAIFCSCASLENEEDAFVIMKACHSEDYDQLIECIKLMIQHGSLLRQKHKDNKKCSELFARLNFDINLQHYFGDAA